MTPARQATRRVDCIHLRQGYGGQDRDAMAGYQLTRVLPGTLGLRPFALSDKAKFFSGISQSLRIAAG